MVRQFHTVRVREFEGSERSLQLATALAQVCDPDTLEKLLQIKTSLDTIGGQVYIAAYRTKYDAATGEPLGDVKNPGVYETDGYLFQYEHIAKVNRQPREPDAKPDETPSELPAFAEDEDAGEAEATE